MRKVFSLFLILLFTFGLVLNTAEAKRFGGGKSFGTQRSSSSYSRTQTPAASATKPASSASRWLGPLAGLAAGGLLAYLLMGHGIGSGILSWLAIAAIGFLIWNFLRNRMRSATQPPYQAYRNQPYQDRHVAHDSAAPFTANQAYSQSNQHTTTYPVGFDADSFLRDAKVQFIRLQAAYDTKNLNDLREFTTPEVFGEIQLQLQERGDAPNQTDVVSLDAQLLDASTEFQSTIATVKFSGLIREEMNSSPAPFNEIWHFRKDITKSGWAVAGIQQD